MTSTDSAREDYYRRVGALPLSPLWTTRLVPPEPKDQVKAKPYLWDYDTVVRPILMESGPLITAKEANRRVLTLENPGLDGSHRILESLYAGLQLILPGEVAPAHRHSPSALRFIIEGEGAYTAVSGEKSYMHRGDFIITPSMTWHDHGHEGSGPVVWMDGLDIPMLGLYGPMFFDNYGDDRHPERRPAGDSRARYGANMRPVNETWQKPESPIFSYPYARSREALEELRRNAEWDPVAGLKLEYIDPDARRQRDADHLDFPAASAQGFCRRDIPQHGEHGLFAGRGQRARHRRRRRRRAHDRLEAARHLRHPVLGPAPARGRRRRNPLQLLRPRRAAEARLLARGPAEELARYSFPANASAMKAWARA